jgi:tRNA guanosine-2'-O-methyltransferase
LALEDVQERQLRNRAGRKKQPLIVCASLIDKVPNLGGLARTSEIFAAEKLIIPNIQIAKMDNFKNLSVSAADWIDIEECAEEVSLTVAYAVFHSCLPNDYRHIKICSERIMKQSRPI